MASRLGQSRPLHQEPDQPSFTFVNRRDTPSIHTSGECFRGTCCSESTGRVCRGRGLGRLPRGGLHGWLHKSLLGLLFCFLFFSSTFTAAVGFWIPSLWLNNSRHHVTTMTCILLGWISFRSEHASFSEYPSECLHTPPSGFLNHCVQPGAGATLALESGVEMTSLRCGASCTGVVCGGQLGPQERVKEDGRWGQTTMSLPHRKLTRGHTLSWPSDRHLPTETSWNHS